ncbi:MAG TPA: M28 family peptidase [Solirubrobacterales bacterium]|nr:M28 family peptidase [Solirubrobacterales bacterium]
MIDFRLYRLSFVPALVAVVVILFSLEPAPEPLEAPVSLSQFDAAGATRAARQTVERAPERPPGSAGDAETADLVADRFSGIAGAQVSEQSISSSFDGDDIETRNVIATLPGDSERRLVVLAPRDTATGPGAASSAAATAVLLELAATFGGASHDRTLVFVSTAGANDGATGAREFAEAYPERDLIDAALVISQPGALHRGPPFVIPWSSGHQSSAMQLTLTAEDVVSAELGEPAGLESSLGDLVRLALPTGLGEQAPLVEKGINAVAVSSAGERPLPPEEDGPESLSGETLAEIGQAAQTIVLALDSAPSPPEHGPGTYVALGDNLLPGWTIAMLALALLVPAGIAAGDGYARALRRGRSRPRDIGWVLGRALPFLGTLVLAYLLATIGLLPSPRFPYDPARFADGWRVAIALVLLLGAFVAACYATRPFSVPRRSDHDGLALAAGAVVSVALLLLWLLNPFLALLAVPAAHTWLAATITDPKPRIGASFAAVAASSIPIAVALGVLGDRLEVGLGIPWHLLLMIAGGQLGAGTSLLGCLILGCLVAVLAASLAPAGARSEPEISVRGPGAGGGGGGGGEPGSARPGTGAAPVVPQTGVDDGRISDVRSLTLRPPRAD